jgi:hypothetical protein
MATTQTATTKDGGLDDLISSIRTGKAFGNTNPESGRQRRMNPGKPGGSHGKEKSSDMKSEIDTKTSKFVTTKKEPTSIDVASLLSNQKQHTQLGRPKGPAQKDKSSEVPVANDIRARFEAMAKDPTLSSKTLPKDQIKDVSGAKASPIPLVKDPKNPVNTVATKFPL